MSTAYMGPAGDASVAWAASGSSTHYLNINGTVRQPTAAQTTTYNFAGADNQPAGSTRDEFTMTTAPTIVSCSQIKIWTYARKGATFQDSGYQINIFIAGSWQTATNMETAIDNSYKWVSATYTGIITQSDLNSLQVRLGAGSDSDQVQVFVSEMYAEITYVAPATVVGTGATLMPLL